VSQEQPLGIRRQHIESQPTAAHELSARSVQETRDVVVTQKVLDAVKRTEGERRLVVSVVLSQVCMHQRALCAPAGRQARHSPRGRGQHLGRAVESDDGVSVAHERNEQPPAAAGEVENRAPSELHAVACQGSVEGDVGPAVPVLQVVKVGIDERLAAAGYGVDVREANAALRHPREYAITLGHANHCVALRWA